MVERAAYLPGIDPADVEWKTLSYDNAGCTVDVEVPALSEDEMTALAARIRQARQENLVPRPVGEIVDIVDRAVARLLDRKDPLRRKAEELLPLVTGYDAEMVRLGLTRYLKTFRKPELKRFLAEDFTNPAILDGFQPLAKGGIGRAYGPPILAHIWAGNVPALPVWSFVAGLLVKAGNIGKVPSAEPLFAGWFAQAVAEAEPDLADCFAIVWWQGGDEERENALLCEADTLLAYGGNASLEAIRSRLPITTRYLPYGHKVSFGVVASSALDTRWGPRIARLAAKDVVQYDQQGCYSPHLFFVERGGRVDPREFARLMANELSNFEKKYPRRALSPAEAGTVARWRQSAEMKSFLGNDNEILGDAAGAWSVAYEDVPTDLVPSGLNRTVKIVAVDRLDEITDLVSPYRDVLQTVGIAATPEELYALSDVLGVAGVTRICALGHMTAPEAGWHHDGRFNLLDLVTMTEIERSSEIAADDLAPYRD